VVNTLQILTFSGLAFFLLLPVMGRTNTLSLDLDWLYRSPGPAVFRAVTAVVSAARARTEDGIRAAAAAAAAAAARLSSPTGLLARTRTVGGMVGWVIALLVLYLILNFV
jgi:multicomponent Na+:H+ antiporter subunit D